MVLLTSLLLVLSHKVDTRQPLTIFAAASLQAPFRLLAREYEASHPLVEVHLNFAGSQTLASQIKAGAPADVFASAAPKNLDSVAIVRGSRRIFARNHLAIAIRKGLQGVHSARDLNKVRYLIVAEPSVPVGAYAEIFLHNASKLYGAAWERQVRSLIHSREADVSAVLAKVQVGEADAGIVYHSDVVTSKVASVPILDRLDVMAEYPVAIPAASTHKAEAALFIKFLMGPGQRALRSAGFRRP